MTGLTQIQSTAARKTWIALRFIVFGVGGFAAIWIGWLSLIIVIDPAPNDERLISPVLAIPLILVGAVMMLYGSGQWRRWQYLWVFLSMPATILALMTLAMRFPKSEFLDSMWAKPLALIWSAAPMPVSYLLVKRYYGRKDASRAPAAESVNSDQQREQSQ